MVSAVPLKAQIRHPMPLPNWEPLEWVQHLREEASVIEGEGSPHTKKARLDMAASMRQSADLIEGDETLRLVIEEESKAT